MTLTIRDRSLSITTEKGRHYERYGLTRDGNALNVSLPNRKIAFSLKHEPPSLEKIALGVLCCGEVLSFKDRERMEEELQHIGHELFHLADEDVAALYFNIAR